MTVPAPKTFLTAHQIVSIVPISISDFDVLKKIGKEKLPYIRRGAMTVRRHPHLYEVNALIKFLDRHIILTDDHKSEMLSAATP